MEALSTFRKKIPVIRWGFMMRCGSRAAESGFGPASKRKVRKRRGQRRTQDGRWPQMPSTRLITTKLHLILARKTETYTIYSGPRVRVSCTEFLPSFDGTLRWRVELCSAVCVGANGWKAATQGSSIMCVVLFLSWDFLLTFVLYHPHIHGT